MIIYSEYLLYNDSGIDLKINSKYTFNIGNNIYLISNHINLSESNFIVYNNLFKSEEINFKELIKSSPYYKLFLNGKTNNFNISIKKKMSFIPIRNDPNFREKIITMIFYIYPICKITNLFQNKKLEIRDITDNKNPGIIIPPLNQISFNFFNKNIESFGFNIIDDNKPTNNTINVFRTFKPGLFTLWNGKMHYNVDVQDSSSDGFFNIYITETDVNKSKIKIINKTNLNFDVYQQKYEKYRQHISENNSHILNIYDQNNLSFIAEIGRKKVSFGFTELKEEFEILIGDGYIILKESNGVKMKITIYTKDEYEQLNVIEKNLYGNIIVNNCYISIIGDNFNKDKNLRNYRRSEILLIYLQNLETKIILSKNKDILYKSNININLNLDKIEIYNQLRQLSEFPCILKNKSTPFIRLNQQFDLYSEDKVVKFNKFNCSMSKLKLCIEPDFIFDLIDFMENITYRLGKINFIVDKIFLRTNEDIRDIEIKKLTNKYKDGKKLICYGNKFNFSSINFDFVIGDINLEKLLKEKARLPYAFIWLISGLTMQNQNIYLDNFSIDNYYGDIGGLVKKIKNNFSSEMFSVIVNLGFQALFGQIVHMFTNEKMYASGIDANKLRKRYPRCFYGKYSYIRNYNELESRIINVVNNLYNKDYKDIYCNDMVLSRKYIFYFSGSALFIFTKKIELYYKIDYKNIEEVHYEGENLVVNYIRDNEQKHPPTVLDCEDDHIAKVLSTTLGNFISC